MAERKSFLLRLDPSVHDALARWAADELRSVNAQIDYLVRRALADAGRLPSTARPTRRPGRPPSSAQESPDRSESPAESPERPAGGPTPGS
ncbi:MAG TPA: hypothetical protein VGH99_21765 [Pseudonocardia sp.]|jgi:hypothetical protein